MIRKWMHSCYTYSCITNERVLLILRNHHFLVDWPADAKVRKKDQFLIADCALHQTVSTLWLVAREFCYVGMNANQEN